MTTSPSGTCSRSGAAGRARRAAATAARRPAAARARLAIARPAEVRDDQDARAALAQRGDRRHREAQPRVVGDGAVGVQRDVELGAQEHAGPARSPRSSIVPQPPGAAHGVRHRGSVPARAPRRRLGWAAPADAGRRVGSASAGAPAGLTASLRGGSALARVSRSARGPAAATATGSGRGRMENRPPSTEFPVRRSILHAFHGEPTPRRSAQSSRCRYSMNERRIDRPA